MLSGFALDDMGQSDTPHMAPSGSMGFGVIESPGGCGFFPAEGFKGLAGKFDQSQMLRCYGSEKQRTQSNSSQGWLCHAHSTTHQQAEGKRDMSKLRRKAEYRARKVNRANSFVGLTDSEIAESIKRTGDGFLRSVEWRNIRQKVIDKYGGKCMCCGLVPDRGINVDHIKPRRYYPHLAFDLDNLQTLCSTCNKRKGNKHTTDYRIPA